MVSTYPRHEAALQTATRNMYLDLDGRVTCLSGSWQWDFNADIVYCSTGMQFPAELVAMKALLHPDYVAKAKHYLLAGLSGPIASVSLKIITTYGEVRQLTGKDIIVENNNIPAEVLLQSPIGKLQDQREEALLQEKNTRRITAAAAAEKMLGAGTWVLNTSSHEMDFSDNLFRLYGVMPQSLNPHLHTFSAFIHHDDAETVKDAFDTAYRSQVPLHISYRIIDALGQLKFVRLSTEWSYDEQGRMLLTGLVQDITEQKQAEVNLNVTSSQLNILQARLQMSEHAGMVASWQTNLHTRKSTFSDQYYRILGLRPHAVTLEWDMVLEQVHAEDRGRVADVLDKIIAQDTVPDTEFRIVRKDGSVKYVQQKCKTVVTRDNEPLVLGTLKDITALRQLQTQEEKLLKEAHIANAAQRLLESSLDIYSWISEIDTGETLWSENFVNLLGRKGNENPITHKLFMSFIHQDDKQLYNNALTHLLEEKAESEIDFRLLVKGETRRVKALFKLIQHAGSQQCLTIIQDCTAQYKQLERFEELSLFSATLSDAIEEACFVTDDRHYIVEWNKNFASHFTKENMPEAGRHLFDLLPDLNDPAFIQEIRQALEGKTVERKTMQTTTGGGWRKHKMIQLQREGSNRVLHILEDNRRNEQLKQRLSANLALLESVLDAIEDRVVVMDKNMNYLYWNRACETYFGIKRNEVVGKNILELSPVFYDDPLYNAFRKALRGEIVHLESPLPGADNRQTSTLLIPVKSDSSNELAFLLWIGYRQ